MSLVTDIYIYIYIYIAIIYSIFITLSLSMIVFYGIVYIYGIIIIHTKWFYIDRPFLIRKKNHCGAVGGKGR